MVVKTLLCRARIGQKIIIKMLIAMTKQVVKKIIVSLNYKLT